MKVALTVLSLIISSTWAIECPEDRTLWCDSREIVEICKANKYCASKLPRTDAPITANTEAKPVVVEVHYESYCPDSRDFVTGELINTWQALNGTGIIEVKLVPYGKACTVANTGRNLYDFYCQHGQNECLGNRIQKCEIKSTQNPVDYLSAIACMMGKGDHNTLAVNCTRSSWDDVINCANSTEGHQLLKEAGVLTKALDPVLNWVPWILINGEHTDGIQAAGTTNLKKLVCDTYTGTRPEECN